MEMIRTSLLYSARVHPVQVAYRAHRREVILQVRVEVTRVIHLTHLHRDHTLEEKEEDAKEEEEREDLVLIHQVLLLRVILEVSILEKRQRKTRIGDRKNPHHDLWRETEAITRKKQEVMTHLLDLKSK